MSSGIIDYKRPFMTGNTCGKQICSQTGIKPFSTEKVIILMKSFCYYNFYIYFLSLIILSTILMIVPVNSYYKEKLPTTQTSTLMI